MKTKKRSKILSLLLALSMLVGMVPFSVIPAMAARLRRCAGHKQLSL